MLRAAHLVSFLFSAAVLPQALAAASISGFSIVDGSGNPLQDARVGDKVTIQSTLQNDDQARPFIFIVQVQDASGYAVFLSVVDGDLAGDPTLRAS